MAGGFCFLNNSAVAAQRLAALTAESAPARRTEMSDPQRTFSGPPRAADIYASVGEATTLAAVEKRLGFTTRGAEGAEAAWLEAVRQNIEARLAPLTDFAQTLS